MEVHISNVPERCTENSLKKFFLPYFSKLSIRCVYCQKPRDKTFAKLTFLSIDDAQKFLLHHGQDQNARNRRPAPPNTTSITLKYLGQPIYCKKSFNEANPYLIRVLQKEEKDRQTKSTSLATIDQSKKPKIFPVIFGCSSVSCGIWTYVDSVLAFEPQVTWTQDGTVKFVEHSTVVTLSSGLRIDFRYLGALSITTIEGPTPSFIFTMQEAPHFYQKLLSDPLSELMAQLGIQSKQQQTRSRKNGPERQRLPCLDDEHKLIAGSCLVYRIALKTEPTSSISSFGAYGDILGDRMQSLRNGHGMPRMIHSRPRIQKSLETFAAGFNRLQQTLSSMAVDIPFVLKFQIQKLAQDNYLPPQTVLQLIPEIRSMMRSSEVPVCVNAIRKLFNQISFSGPEADSTEFELNEVVEYLKENESQCKREVLTFEGDESRGSENLAIIHRARVTPAGIRLMGPEAETNNRVLRKYPKHHEYFLRVQFSDEDGQPVRFNPRISNEKIFHGRFKDILEKGINIAGREYAFLGFSHSSLRAQSCWFMAPFVYEGSLMYDRLIIQDLGNFSVIRSPAKCAARIGQVFSDTRTAVRINTDVVQNAADVKRGDRVFSDGVGTMSSSIMYTIWDSLPKARVVKPTLFQIRFQGAKGMISLDSRLPGDALVLRPSMIKFDGSTSADIEICEAPYKPLPMYLNRQFIKILEDMGVDDKFFLDLQAQEVERLRMITNSPINASSFLKRQSIGGTIHLSWLISELALLDLDFRSDGFLRDVLEMALLVELRLLKHKTRIPVEHGWHLHGLLDETGLLKEGQIYCSVLIEGMRKIILGENLIISRAPALHPGDVQLVEGIQPPPGSPLLNLYNCICFSSKGTRDLPSQLSGGDLDGDRYYIMWDPRARPKCTYTPADYRRQDPIDIGRMVQRSDMTDFFIKFMETDQLGRIAVLHRVLADQKDAGTSDPDCITLAEMHSTAVDFSKTGIPVDMSKTPKHSPWRPDFEAPGPHVKIEKLGGVSFEEAIHREPDEEGDEDDDFTSYRYYESNKILGKLYRAIDEREIFDQIKQRTMNHVIDEDYTVIEVVWGYVQERCRLIQWEHHLEMARDIRDMYEEKLLNIMKTYSEHLHRPLSELEAFIGNILGKTGSQTKHQRELSTTMKERFDEDAAFIVNCIVRDGGERSDEALERSMACLAVSLDDKYSYKRRDQLLSFKYVAAAVCLRELERLPF